MIPSYNTKDNNKHTIVKKVAESIRKEIMYGNLKPGEHLKEYKLAKNYNTSRVPVREAFRILHSEGYVDMIPNRGSFVKRINPNQVHEYTLVYKVLGPIILRDAVNYYKKSTFKKSRTILDKIEKCKDFNKIGYLLWDFAHVIFGCSKFEFIMCIMDEIYKHNIRSLNNIFIKTMHGKYDTSVHRKYLELCEKGEKEEAVKLWFEYVDRLAEEIKKIGIEKSKSN